MPTRPTTPEQKRDAGRLRILFDRWKQGLADQGEKVTQEEVAHRLGTGQSTLSQRLSGRLALNRDFSVAIATLIGCKVLDFSPTLAAEIEALTQPTNDSDDFAMVQRVDVCFAAGNGGALVYDEASKSALSFRRSFLQEIGVKPASAVIVSVKGHSMEPTIRDGAVILVSRAATTIIDREIYAFRIDESLYVKRIIRDKVGKLIAISDNPDRESFPDMPLELRDHGVEIIGRALWMGAKL